MDSRRFRRLKVLYGAAAELPPEEIPEFLEAACPDDAEVRSALDRMLGAGAAGVGGDEIGRIEAALQDLLRDDQKR